MPVTDQRFAAQLLTGSPAAGPVDVVTRILAVQAQDLRGARLAIRARTSGLHVRDVDRALTQDRSLVLTWLNRGTLHLVRPKDYWWLQQLTTPQLLTGNTRRLQQEGVSPAQAERGVELVDEALAGSGPQTRVQLRERLAAAGIPVAGQAFVHILMLTALRGITVRGPVVGGEQAFVRVHDWLADPPSLPDRTESLAVLCRRYLLGHSPATERDLAMWAGLPLRDVRAGLAAVADEVEPLQDGLLRHVDAPPGKGVPPPRMLGPFDPLLHGWVSREAVLGGHTGIVTSNGLFRPFALVRGRAVATWSMAGGRVTMTPFEPVSEADAAALAQDTQDVLRYLRADTSARPDEPGRLPVTPAAATP